MVLEDTDCREIQKVLTDSSGGFRSDGAQGAREVLLIVGEGSALLGIGVCEFGEV